ncbi:MAG: histidine phosphatase family protein [Chloroflexota bacterium]
MTLASIRFITMIRHGQYHTARQDDGELTLVGIEQIKLAARALRMDHFDTIYYSPMRRAEQSAQVIARSFPNVTIKADDLLRECVPSVPPRLEAIFQMHRRKMPHTQDALDRCLARFEMAWERFAEPPQDEGDEVHDLLVCHGNIIRYFVARALTVATDTWINMLMHNGGITRLRVDTSGETTLISHNDMGHLPPRLRTQT